MSGNKGGRPTEYNKDITPILAEGWARQGLNNEQIANNLGITTSTLYEWQNKFSEFSEALRRGKEVVDFEVENALYKKAIGYQYTETTKRIVVDKEGDERVIEIIEHDKAQHPSDKAIEMWLRNRRPDKWADKESIRETPPPIVNIEIKDNSEVQKEFEKYDT